MKNFFKKLFCSDSMSKHFSETVRRIGKNNAGFSLVELIVVIAIMAILSAVAVIGVSVYIPKAQQANDKQMIADIQKAIDLYCSAETLTPGQSGYVVVRKAGGVAVGGTMETANNQQLISGALKATFGEGYSNELKVAYGEWTGTISPESAEIVAGSSYYENTGDLLNKVQDLTNALSGYYGGNNQAANQAALDIANVATYSVDKEAFIDWWKTAPFGSSLNSGIVGTNASGQEVRAFDTDGYADSADLLIKCELAAEYARAEAFVLATGCPECKKAFDEGGAEFDNAAKETDKARAIELSMTAVLTIMGNVSNHISGCTDGNCKQYLGTSYDDGTYSLQFAENDAKAYLALMGQVDSMSDTIKDSAEYGSDSLYNSDFVVNAVNGYTATTEAFNTSGAVDGDIVIIAIVGNDGKLTYKVYPLDY